MNVVAPVRRALLLMITLLLGVTLLALMQHRGERELQQVAWVDPYAQVPLLDYGAVQRLRRDGDTASLEALAPSLTGYLAFTVAWQLANSDALTPHARLAWFDQAMALRIADPLNRAEERAMHVRWGAAAEAAGDVEKALAAYRVALPDPAATEALWRLPLDPMARANAFLQGRRYREALQALAGASAPSIEAPAHRALGEHAQALAAYQRWLREDATNREAREGEAWSLFSLERWSDADAKFAALGGATGAYGRGLVAGRQGRIDDGVRFMLQAGRAGDLWIAAGWLEARNRTREAINIYLQLARLGEGSLVDDAAYRARVLALRVGDRALAAAAEALIPSSSFFYLLLGGQLAVPSASAGGVGTNASSTAVGLDARPEALALARALFQVGDTDAAVGELLFALRDAEAALDYGDANATERIIAIAQALQSAGEYRLSARSARVLLRSHPDDRRVWELAYPRAYPDAVAAAAAAFGVEPALVWAIMRQESAFSTVAVSTSNAQGLMQVIPSTWSWIAELKRVTAGDPFDIGTNIAYGTYYLRWLLNYFDGDMELSIASYNRGQGYIGRLFAGNVVQRDKDELYRYIDALETREYLQVVQVNLAVYRALYD